MASIRYLMRTDKPLVLKAFIDKALNFDISLRRIKKSVQEFADSNTKIIDSSYGGWYGWYTDAKQESFEHCLYLAVVETCSNLYFDIREQSSDDLNSWGIPGKEIAFDRPIFLEHLEKYKASTHWLDEEKRYRLPYPREVVGAGLEPPDYVLRFCIIVSGGR